MSKIVRLTEGDLTRIVRRVINEFDYESHKNKNIELIDRFSITINPGSEDVIEMEGLLGRNIHTEHLVFKLLQEVDIYSSSDSRELIKDKKISLYQAHSNTQSTAEFLNKHIGDWLGIVTDGQHFIREIPVGENIRVGGFGANFIGSLRCIFNNIKFETI